MKRHRRRDLYLLLCGVLVWFLADAAALRRAAVEALTLCARSAVPALFPIMAVTNLLVAAGFGQWLAPAAAGIMNALFHLPGSAAAAWVLGIVGGYPIGASTAAELRRSGALTAEEAERLLTFCNNSGPAFFISVLGSGVFGSVRTGVWLWLIHIAASMLSGMFFRGGTLTRRREAPPQVTARTLTLSAAFVDAVRGAALAMVSICGFVVFFYVLASPLRSIGGTWAAGAVGVLELFSLTPLLRPTAAHLVLASFCAGWGGVSVLCQTAAVLAGSGLRLGKHVLAKALQGLFAAALTAALAPYILP